MPFSDKQHRCNHTECQYSALGQRLRHTECLVKDPKALCCTYLWKQKKHLWKNHNVACKVSSKIRSELLVWLILLKLMLLVCFLHFLFLVCSSVYQQQYLVICLLWLILGSPYKMKNKCMLTFTMPGFGHLHYNCSYTVVLSDC